MENFIFSAVLNDTLMIQGGQTLVIFKFFFNQAESRSSVIIGAFYV